METTLLKLMNNILWVMERQEIMVFTCMNLSAAFHMVGHDIFLHVFSKMV